MDTLEHIYTLGEDYLEHHGILGMKWGIRRTPEQLGHARLKNAKTSNMDKWGKSPDTNSVYITGYSGGGKSTAALSLMKPGDTYVNLDFYSDEVTSGANKFRNKNFEKYLDKHVPEWKKIATYDANKADYRARQKHWKQVDEFAKAIESYSKQEYKKGNRVIVEGIQIAENWLHDSPDFYASKPLITIETGKRTAQFRRILRDKDPVKEVLKSSLYSKEFDQSLQSLKTSANVQKGDEWLKDYLNSKKAA